VRPTSATGPVSARDYLELHGVLKYAWHSAERFQEIAPLYSKWVIFKVYVGEGKFHKWEFHHFPHMIFMGK
jgi:hypothetical protein